MISIGFYRNKIRSKAQLAMINLNKRRNLNVYEPLCDFQQSKLIEFYNLQQVSHDIYQILDTYVKFVVGHSLLKSI